VARKSKSIGSRIRGQALREFRHSVSILKRKGLTSKKVDARRQRATRYMLAKVKSLADVIAGKAAGVRRSRAIAREYKEAGFKVVNNRVILPADQAKRAIRNVKSRTLITTEKLTAGGTIERRVILPVGVNNIETFLANEDRIDALKDSNRWFAFTYYGHRSTQVLPNATSLFMWLRHYGIAKGGSQERQEAWDQFILLDLREDYAIQWREEAQAASRVLYEKRLRRYRPRRMLNDSGDIVQPRRRLTYEEYTERDRERKRIARQSESYLERERVRNRERMRKTRGTKKPRV